MKFDMRRAKLEGKRGVYRQNEVSHHLLLPLLPLGLDVHYTLSLE